MNASRAAKEPLFARARKRFGRSVSSWGVFFRGFVKHPVMVGSIIPSSQATVDKMLSRVDWDNCDLFVEYGPGIGTFCWTVLEKLRPDAKLIVIDTNPDFIAYLKQHIHDPRFVPVNGSAADVNRIIADAGHDHADYVLSGLPFSTLPGDLGPRIAEETGKAVRPGGAFLVYQFRERARDFMMPHFDRIDRDFIWWNIPPCHLFWGWKK